MTEVRDIGWLAKRGTLRGRGSEANHRRPAGKAALLFVAAMMLSLLLLHGEARADLFSWEDQNGAHFVDDIAKVPKKYRKQAMRPSPEADAPAQPATRAPAAPVKSAGEGSAVQGSSENGPLFDEEEVSHRTWQKCFYEIKINKTGGRAQLSKTSSHLQKTDEGYQWTGLFTAGTDMMGQAVLYDFVCDFDSRLHLVHLEIAEKETK